MFRSDLKAPIQAFLLRLTKSNHADCKIVGSDSMDEVPETRKTLVESMVELGNAAFGSDTAKRNGAQEQLSYLLQR